jgi:leucyl aminopeptidase
MRSIHIAVGFFLATFAGFAFADPSTITLASLTNAAMGSAAGALVSGLFGSDKKSQQQAAAPPPVEPVTPMPTADSTNAAKQKSIVAQIQRQGRASSILTAGNAGSDAMG